MEGFLSTAYGQVAAVVTGLGVVYGLITYYHKTKVWVNKKIEEHRERQAAPQKILDLIQKMREDSDKRDDEMNDKLEHLKERMECMENKLDLNDEATATLQSEKLNWAYDHYGVKRNPISIQTKTSLQEMKRLYTLRGHNHLPEDWSDRINNAPIIGEAQ